MTATEKIKQMIIQNWILFEKHREPTKEEEELISSYIEEDHVNEITQSLCITEDEIGVHTICQNCSSSTNL